MFRGTVGIGNELFDEAAAMYMKENPNLSLRISY
jgi:hypothetical protein